MHVREISAQVLAGKGLEVQDRALADATVKRMRDVLLLHKRKGIVRLVGLQRARSAKWGVVDSGRVALRRRPRGHLGIVGAPPT
jgi:hypothetical protein